MKHLRTKIIFTISLLLILFTALVSCNKNTHSNTIRIGVLEGPSAVSFIRMLDDEHIINDKKVEIIIKNEPFQIQAMMMKNELDFAVLPTVMAANLYNKGVKYRMVACPIWGTLYVLSNDEKINTLSDLEEEQIAVFGQGSTADILTKNLIRKEDICKKGVDYRFDSNQEITQALAAGKIKNAVISEPLVSILIHQNPNIRIIEKLNCNGYMEDSERNYFIQSAFVVSDKFINTHPHLIPQVCNAYMNSCNFVNENPESVAKSMVKHKIAPDEHIAAKSIELCNIQYVAAFALSQELYHYLHIFHSESPESIGGKIPGHDFIYHIYSASHDTDRQKQW